MPTAVAAAGLAKFGSFCTSTIHAGSPEARIRPGDRRLTPAGCCGELDERLEAIRVVVCQTFVGMSSLVPSSSR